MCFSLEVRLLASFARFISHAMNLVYTHFDGFGCVHYAAGDVSVAMAAHAMANVASAVLWLKKNDVELR